MTKPKTNHKRITITASAHKHFDDPTLADRLAPMSIAEIDAMSDDEAAALMGATPEEIASERKAGRAWTWRESAKASTNEFRDKVWANVQAGRLKVYEGDEARKRLGRPSLGAGESVQIRARLSPDLAALLDAAVARSGRPRSAIVREALERYLRAS